MKSSNPIELFTDGLVLKYLGQKVSKKCLDEHFLNKLTEKQLEKFITECKKQGLKSIDFTSLLNRLLNMESLQSISLDLVPLLFENKESHWDNLYKCIKLCPEAEEMIYSQYLAFNRDQPEQMLELVTFYR